MGWASLAAMHFLFITNDFGPRAGGIETFIIGLIEGLPKNSTIVYTSAQSESSEYDAKWFQSYGVRVIRDKSRVLLPSTRVSMAVKKLARDEKIEVAVFGAAAPLGLLAPSLRAAGVLRIISLTHGHEVWWAKVFPFNIVMRRIGSTVDSLTYLGDFTRAAIGACLTKNARSSMVKIAPGIDVERFKPTDASGLRKELGLSDKRVIVSVGRLVRRKGQDRLIKSLVEVLKFIPNAHLLLVGEGPYRGHLEKLVKKFALEENVTFLGRIQYEELPRYICVGDIFAMPSRSRFFGLEVEGLGIVYLEASACGLPVIAGNSGGAPDAVLEGITGLVVDGLDNGAIAAALLTLLENDAKAKTMGEGGRKWIVENWRWEIWAKEFRGLLGIIE